MKRRAAVLGLTLVLAACASGTGPERGTGLGPPANASLGLVDLEGETVGIALLTEGTGGVFLEIELTGVASGGHGIHVYETGDCTPPFAGAGDHFNPEGKKHGRDNPTGPHVGDLANVHVPESMILSASFLVEGATLKTRARASLADQDGSALVVHQDLDDYETDPEGNAGSRIACGVIFANPS